MEVKEQNLKLSHEMYFKDLILTVEAWEGAQQKKWFKIWLRVDSPHEKKN